MSVHLPCVRGGVGDVGWYGMNTNIGEWSVGQRGNKGGMRNRVVLMWMWCRKRVEEKIKSVQQEQEGKKLEVLRLQGG